MTGAELRALRETHKLSQVKMAALLGISRSRLRLLEERGGELKPVEQARLSEWDTDAPEVGDAGEAGETDDGVPDALPDAEPLDAADAPEPEAGERPKRKRAASPRRRALTGWQEETAAALIALFNGEQLTLETGQVVFIPGVCHFLQQVEPYDAQVVAAGMPALAVALVKVAPRHPFLRSLLTAATGAGDYQELLQAAALIALPILAHHGLFGPAPIPTLGPADERLDGDHAAG